VRVADGDRGMLPILGQALSGIRKAKSEAKVKQRTEVLTAVVSAPSELLSQLEAGLGDLRAAANARSIELRDGAGELTVSDVELAPAEA
jgi:valyl-tRNA synthetase